MVDFRPLLFINAFALMLLVKAGFASVRDDLAAPAEITRQQSGLSAAGVDAHTGFVIRFH